MPHILLTLSALFWSGNFVLSRGMHAEIPPIGLAFWRWSIALLILAPFGLRPIFLSGDAVACRQAAAAMEGIQTYPIDCPTRNACGLRLREACAIEEQNARRRPLACTRGRKLGSRPNGVHQRAARGNPPG